MSFWKKLLGKDFDVLVDKGTALLEDGRPGEARLELEQALANSQDADKKRVESVRKMIARARDELAHNHMTDGETFASEGNLDRATECYETAAEVADSEELRAEALRLVDRIEADDAREAYEEAREMTDEERFIALSGTWENDQADEMEYYGDEFRDAYLTLHEGKAKEAAEKMAILVEEHEGVVYLYLELAIAQQAAEMFDEAILSIKTFLEHLDELYPPEEDEDDEEEEEEEEEDEPRGTTARIRAHTELARIYLDLDDVESAEKQLRTLIELMPEKPSPYVALGQFLRAQDRAEESLEVLELGHKFMGEIQPDMSVMREIGLTQEALGADEQAITALKAVIEYQAGMVNFNYDPHSALPLAKLYEKTGEKEEALHIYRHLAAGTHAAGHFTYNLEAGRLLVDKNEADLARKYLSRAKELAKDDEARAKAVELLDELEKGAEED